MAVGPQNRKWTTQRHKTCIYDTRVGIENKIKKSLLLSVKIQTQSDTDEHLERRFTVCRCRVNRDTGGGEDCSGGRDCGGGVTSSSLSSLGFACSN